MLRLFHVIAGRSPGCAGLWPAYWLVRFFSRPALHNEAGNLEYWSLLQLSGAELAQREAIQYALRLGGLSCPSITSRQQAACGKLEQAPALQIRGLGIYCQRETAKSCEASGQKAQRPLSGQKP